MPKAKVYTAEQKLIVMRELAAGDKTQPAISADTGVSLYTIGQWNRERLGGSVNHAMAAFLARPAVRLPGRA